MKRMRQVIGQMMIAFKNTYGLHLPLPNGPLLIFGKDLKTFVKMTLLKDQSQINWFEHLVGQSDTFIL